MLWRRRQSALITTRAAFPVDHFKIEAPAGLNSTSPTETCARGNQSMTLEEILKLPEIISAAEFMLLVVPANVIAWPAACPS